MWEEAFVREMHLIEIFLPVGNTKADRHHLERIECKLTERFGGVTVYARAPAKGLFKDNQDTERDDITVLEVMADNLDEDWWKGLRDHLQRDLSEKEILIRASRIQKL